ncbi:hypothetical protein AA14362_0907 [Acetobacter cerevisiae DSM 14362]|nr:hypothetical protein AA14362_0907 [Acetobacter cerevisiae DSM 14362]
MQQRGGMNKLDAGRNFDMPQLAVLIIVPAEPGRSQRQQRTQALAPSGNKMRGELRDKRNRALHSRNNNLITGAHILREVIGQGF